MVVAGGVTVAVRGGQSRAQRFESALRAEERVSRAQEAAGRPYLPETITAIQSLKSRPGFRALVTGCQLTRCFVDAQPPAAAASELPGLLESIGANTTPTVPEVVGVRVARRRWNLNRCTHGLVHPALVTCTYLALLHHNDALVFLGPYIRCSPAPCRLTHETEINVSVPGIADSPTPR